MKKHFTKIKIYVCLAVMIFSVLIPLKVFAYDEGFFSANDILFYDPDACGGDTSGGSGNSSVVAIGDSLLANDQQTGKLEEKLKANKYTDVTIDAQSSRFIDGGSVPTGLEAIDTNKAKITAAGTIIVVLGTNYPGSRSTFNNNVKKFMTNIRALNKDARVFWVNIVNAGVTASANGANSVIEDADNIKTYNYSVVDWHKAVYANGQADTSLLSMSDGGYHQSNPTGINKHVSLIVDAVGKYTEPSNSAPGSGTDKNLESILRYATGKGLSLAAAAGIAGNLKRESGFNPAVIQGGAIAPDNYTPVDGVGFGLAQWTSNSRQGPLVAMAKKEGKKITDITLQLDYLWSEALKMKPMIKRLNAIKSTSTYGSASAPMAAAILFHGKTDAIMANPTREITDVDPPFGFEASADTARGVVDIRGKAAESIYKTYKGKIQDGTGVSGVGTDPSDTPGNATDCGSTSPTGGQAGEFGWDLEGSHAMVYYNQADSQWANKPFGHGTLGPCGCGPTSLAMIVSTLTGDKSVTPATMGDFYASHGGQVASPGCGSTWNWGAISTKWPVKVTDIGHDISKAKAVLKNGGLVLFSWGGAPFTSGGHIMVMRKYSPDGKIYIASSGGTMQEDQSKQAWDQSVFTDGYHGGGGSGNLSGMWGIEKK